MQAHIDAGMGQGWLECGVQSDMTCWYESMQKEAMQLVCAKGTHALQLGVVQLVWAKGTQDYVMGAMQSGLSKKMRNQVGWGNADTK